MAPSTHGFLQGGLVTWAHLLFPGGEVVGAAPDAFSIRVRMAVRLPNSEANTNELRVCFVRVAGITWVFADTF